MDTQTILNEMSLIFREVLKRENIVLDNETTAQDVEGWDSLTNMQLINKIEKKFNVRFTFRDIYNPQIQISAESETKRSIFRKRDKTKRSKKESAQHSKSRNKSFVMTSVSAL